MTTQTQETIRTSEEAISKLVELCSKLGPLYVKNPRIVAQVSRTGKWLLNAIAALRRELKTSSEPNQQSK
jgi:hypothetical protein